MSNAWAQAPEEIMVSFKARPEFERYCAGGDPLLALGVIAAQHQIHIEFTLSQHPELAREDTGGLFCTEIDDCDLAVVDMMMAQSEGGGRVTLLVTRAESQNFGEKFMYLLKNMPLTGEDKPDEILH